MIGYKVKDDINIKAGDHELQFLASPFLLVSKYKTQNLEIWESFIGLAPEYYGLNNSFVTLMEKEYGIEPFVQLDFQKTRSSIIKFGDF